MIKLTGTSLYQQELENLNDFISFKLRTKDTTCIEKLNQLRTQSNTLPKCNVNLNNSTEFKKQLLDTFNNNPPSNDGTNLNRIDLLYGFSDYLVTNDCQSFQWFPVVQGEVSYNNILYTLYKLLVSVNKEFLTDNETLNVYSVVKNKLNYLLEVELPLYFTYKHLNTEITNMNKILETLHLPLTVDITLLDKIKNRYKIEFLNQDRFHEFFALGDVLRWSDFETGLTTLDLLGDPSLELPVVLGLQANNKPYIVDLSQETSTLIMDDNRSQHIWLSRIMLMNLVVMNHYRDLNITLIDTSKYRYWEQFATLPHVTKHENSLGDILNTLRGIKSEMDKRNEFIIEQNYDNFKHLRSELKRTDQRELLDSYPYLTIVLDELTNTLSSLRWFYKYSPDKYMEVVQLLETITKDGRGLGVHLISVGQWVQNEYLPRNLLTNSSLRIGKRLQTDEEYLTLYGKDFIPLTQSLTMNCSYVRSSQSNDVLFMKDAVIGGHNDEQIEEIIQYVYLHWVARSCKQ